MSLFRIGISTIAEEIKDEFFITLKAQLQEPGLDLLLKLKIEKILALDKCPVNRESIMRIAKYYGFDKGRYKMYSKRMYFTRPEAQIIKKAIREIYLLGV